MPRNIVIHPDKKQSKAVYSGIPLKELLNLRYISCTFFYNILQPWYIVHEQCFFAKEFIKNCL